MDQYIIRGGNPLVGEVEISGAKNAALGILAAACMTDDTVLITNLPDVRDIFIQHQTVANGSWITNIFRGKMFQRFSLFIFPTKVTPFVFRKIRKLLMDFILAVRYRIGQHRFFNLRSTGGKR